MYFKPSERYKELIYSRNSRCLLNVYVEDKLIEDDDIIDFSISHNLFGSDKFTLGTTPAKTVEVEINKKALPEKYNNFYVETGLNISGTDEIIPIGYFVLDEIKQDDDTVMLTLIDYMINFERIVNVRNILPCTTLNLLKYLCNICGVELRIYFICE